MERLEGEQRRQTIPPEGVVRRMHLSKQDTVVDLGAGIGYFAFPISKRVEAVVAVDIEPKMIEILNRRSKDRHVANLKAVRAEAASTPIDSGFADHVLAAFIYHEVPDRIALLKEAARILKDRGRLTIVDFQKKETEFGPPLEERITPATVRREAGILFSLVGSYEHEVFYQLEFEKRGR